jgi:hypothetical protein
MTRKFTATTEARMEATEATVATEATASKTIKAVGAVSEEAGNSGPIRMFTRGFFFFHYPHVIFLS